MSKQLYRLSIDMFFSLTTSNYSILHFLFFRHNNQIFPSEKFGYYVKYIFNETLLVYD